MGEPHQVYGCFPFRYFFSKNNASGYLTANNFRGISSLLCRSGIPRLLAVRQLAFFIFLQKNRKENENSHQKHLMTLTQNTTAVLRVAFARGKKQFLTKTNINYGNHRTSNRRRNSNNDQER